MKIKLKFLILVLFFVSTTTFAQKFITKNGYVRFFSATSMENIDGKNKQVSCALDATTGDFVFKLLEKSFEFERALMQEHFNENYVESDKFPEATFKGKVLNIKDVNFSKPGVYKVTVEGDLTLHGVSQKIKTEGTIETKGEKINAKSKFVIKLKDYKISIPKAVADKISENMEITVDVNLDKINK